MREVGRNRLANVNNRYQDHDKYRRVLCVCSAGMLRSPTVAWVLSNPPFNFNTRAVGCDPEFALIPIDDALIAWADEIVCMDLAQQYTVENYQDKNETRALVHALNIPDDYNYRDQALVKIVHEKCLVIFGMENPKP